MVFVAILCFKISIVNLIYLLYSNSGFIKLTQRESNVKKLNLYETKSQDTFCIIENVLRKL